jgi:hypothetical protein
LINALGFGLLGILIISMGGFSFAQTTDPELTVTTNNGSYDEGDMIVISGKASVETEEATILIQIWKGGDMVNIGQINSNRNGDYTHTIIAEGPTWSQGTYVVRASYGEEGIAETIFTFGNSVLLDDSPSPPIDSSGTNIMINMDEDTFYLDSQNQIVRASVEIQNYTPSDGVYFMKVTHLPTQKVLKDFEIYPKASGNDLWSVQIAYPILESDIKIGNQTLEGEFEIHISTEYGSQTASIIFSIFESPSNDQPQTTLVENADPISEPSVETISEEPSVETISEEPSVETISEEPSVETISEEPSVETISEELSVETISEVEELSEKSEIIDEPLSVKMDEKSIQNLFDFLPYLAIIFSGIITAIIVIKIRNKGKDDELSEDYEYDEDSENENVIENASISKNFQDMQDLTSNTSNEVELDKIIENKLHIISKLQEHKIGNIEKLDSIKKSLIENGSFTQEENDYLDSKYEEYKKIGKNKT